MLLQVMVVARCQRKKSTNKLSNMQRFIRSIRTCFENLDRPYRDYGDVEVGDEVSENSVKDQTYLGMFRTEKK